MAPEVKDKRLDRHDTDESLRIERGNTDEAIAHRAEVEQSADDLIEHARKQADSVLNVAREKADEAGAEARAALVKERARADDIVDDERAAADEILRREREEQARTLATFLPLEREETNRHLLTERARSDHKIANRDDFLGMVSHDLRNLLCGISLEASALSDEGSVSDTDRRTIGASLQRYVARMNGLIGDLLDIVSIDAGKLAVQRKPDDAAALIAEAVEAFTPSAAQKGVSLSAEVPEAALMADLDHNRMLQVLANLISNALKFTARGGAVAVRGERVEGAVHVSVVDTGIGIPSSMLQAVFERFWQVGRDDRRGLGLGLYISKCILDAHGGRIWVESVEGKGSSFQFTIPRDPD